MKLYFRMTQSANNGTVIHTMQIMRRRWANSLTMSVVGHLTFYEFEGDFFDPELSTNGRNPDNFKTMYKIAKAIKGIYYEDRTPLNIKESLDLEEVVLVDFPNLNTSEFITHKDTAKKMYRMAYVDEKGEERVYTTFISTTRSNALAKARRMQPRVKDWLVSWETIEEEDFTNNSWF